MKEKIILKSAHPEEYPDLVIECKVIQNDKIGEYVASIPEERKFYAYKKGSVAARPGVEGKTIKTTLTTVIDGKEYILDEEENTVKKREYKGEEKTDIVVMNLESTSREQYIVKYQKFIETYIPKSSSEFVPVYEERALAQVDENIIIITSWGAKALCLKGSYIVTYNEETNDYNTLEQGAFFKTYAKVEGKNRKKIHE